MADLSKGVRAQEVQAALVVAQKCPRDQNKAYARIIQACERRSLAEKASYVFQRGGTPINGASIDLLEVIAQNWGNMQSGVVELEQRDGESTMMAFAWDLETNFYDSKTFTVKHRTESKSGGVKELKSENDIYYNNANFAARRKRACMEAVIPRDIVEAAREKCEETLAKTETEPLVDRVRKMVVAFSEVGVTVEMIEGRFNHKLDAIVEQEFVQLRKIYKSLRDGMSTREQWFELPGQADKTPSQPKRETVTTPKKEKKETPPPAGTQTPPQETTIVVPKEEEKHETSGPSGPDASGTDLGPVITIDRAKPFESLKALADNSGVTHDQVLGYAKAVRMAKPSAKNIGEMRESDMIRIIDSWEKILNEIKKVQVAK